MQANCRLKAVITIAIRLRYDYDPTTTYRARLLPFDPIRREQKMNISIYCSRVVVVSQSNRTQIVISITSVVVECVVVSSYSSRIVQVESQCDIGLRAGNGDERRTGKSQSCESNVDY